MTLPSIIGLWSPAAGCGKSTVAGILIEAGGHRIEPFAGTLKRMLVSMLQDAGLIQSEALRLVWLDKLEPIGCLTGAINTRRLQQTLGTEWGRDLIGPDLWVDIWRRRVTAPPLGPIVADDVRMLNEAAAVRSLGGEGGACCGLVCPVVISTPPRPGWAMASCLIARSSTTAPCSICVRRW